MAVGDIAPIGKAAEAMRSGKAAGLFPREPQRVVFANLEIPLSEKGRPIFKVGPRLHGKPEMAAALEEMGVTAANLANNHILDFGPEALVDTMENLKRQGIAFFGAGITAQQARAPRVLEAGSFRLGFVGFCEKEESIAAKKRPGAAEMREGVIAETIDELRGQVDFVILSLHFGIEFADFPTLEDMYMCRRLVERGADVILGHHPHVPQGFERYRDGVILYSLGNFLFDMGEEAPARAKLGYAYQLHLSAKGVEDVLPLPYRADENYLPYFVSGGEKQELLDYLERLSDPLRDPKRMGAISHDLRGHFLRQLLKALWYRTVVQKRWWYPFWWCQILFRPQVRRAWMAYPGGWLRGYRKGIGPKLAHLELR